MHHQKNEVIHLCLGSLSDSLIEIVYPRFESQIVNSSLQSGFCLKLPSVGLFFSKHTLHPDIWCTGPFFKFSPNVLEKAAASSHLELHLAISGISGRLESSGPPGGALIFKNSNAEWGNLRREITKKQQLRNVPYMHKSAPENTKSIVFRVWSVNRLVWYFTELACWP